MPMAEEKPTPVTDEQTASPETLSPNAQLRDKRILPEGVVPKQAQGYVIAGLTVMILMAVLFSEGHARPAAPATAAPSTTVSNDANARRIEELEQNLTAEQRQSQQQQAQKPPTNASNTGNAPSAQAGNASPALQTPPPTPEAQPDPIADAERELAFKSRFASNLISADGGSAHSSSADSANVSDENSQTSGVHTPEQQRQAPTSESAASKRSPEVNINEAHGQPYVLFEGTTIDTALVNRLDGEFSGDVKVMVTNPVYSQNGQHVLIPEGTFILGNMQKVGGLGQKRLAVTFHRMLMPDGYSVDLDRFHGLDQVGDTGLKDKVNNHYIQIFGASIALGVIAGATQSTTYGSYTENGSDMYRQGMATSLAQSGTNVLDKFLNIPPTVTIREGHRVKVYFTQDMLLPAYENHEMPGVM
jgi:type IV secretory pathway VirB10-like protein